MVIKTNVPGIHTMHKNIKIRGSVSKTIEKLSSGFRINRAADDAAGLGVSETMREQITELTRAQRNVQEGIDVTRTADGALEEINSMLIRARELCIEGANGIYSDLELDSISNEINEIFDDIDRITEVTRHNDIQLFRYEGVDLDLPKEDVKPDDNVKYDYIDHFEEVPFVPDNVWGEIDFVEERPFDRPSEAIPSTVTLTLDKDIDLNDAMTLDGKSVTIAPGYKYGKYSSFTYVFNGGYSALPMVPDNPENKITTIFFKKGMTVQDVLKKLEDNIRTSYESSGMLASITLNKENRTVTFTKRLEQRGVDVWADGEKRQFSVLTGITTNIGAVSSMEGNSLAEVDGSRIENNPLTFGATATGVLPVPSGPLIADSIQRNSLYIFNGSNAPVNIPITGLQADWNQDQIGEYLRSEIDKLANYTAKYENGELTVTAENLPPDTAGNICIVENCDLGTPPSWGPSTEGPDLPVSAVDFEVRVTQEASGEQEEYAEITINHADVPCCIQINRQKYILYDPSSYPPAGFTLNSLPSDVTLYYEDKGKQLIQQIAGLITRFVAGCDLVGIDGNTIKVKSDSMETSLKLEDRLKKTSASLGCYKPGDYIPGTPDSQPIFGYRYNRFEQEVSVSFDLGSSPADLAGKGFSFFDKKIEFVNGAGSGIRDDYIPVDISGCADTTAVAKKLGEAMGTSFSVAPDSGTKVKITRSKETDGYQPFLADGYHDKDGIFTNPGDEPLSETFKGGADEGFPQAEIDFSSINNDNLDQLLGKGFRITCATCGGEYINVFFCWEKNDSMPTSLKNPDPSDPDNPDKIRTIHNIAVELSKVSNGEKIVEDIVNQVSSQLTHYTGLQVGDPPTTLIAMDKRPGDRIDQNGKLLQAEILSGIATNFKYTYEKVEVKEDPPDTPENPDQPDLWNPPKMDFRNMLIYVGSEPDHQWIPLHLPWLDLHTLCLSPPEKVDLGGGENPFDWLKRVDAANERIIASRTQIGADHNRLEHTYNALTRTGENLKDAESRIRDADMARLMTQYMKEQIVGQVQQSMMMHANNRPQQILELLK